MKKIIAVFMLLSMIQAYSFAQSIGIGSSQFTPTSMLEIRSTNNTAGTYGFKLLNSSSATMMFIQNDGNVGIGSATPARKIDIVGDGKISGTLYGTSYNQDMVATGDNNWTFGGFNSGSNYWMQSTYWDTGDNLRGFRIFNKNASDVVFSTNKTYSLFPFGNIGIGITTPGAKLVVSDNATAVTAPANTVIHVVGSNAATGPILIDGFTGGGIFRGRLANNTAASPTAVTQFQQMAVLSGRGHLGTGYPAGDQGRVAIAAEENFGAATAKTGIAFETTAAGAIASSEKMRLNGDGNLGIGTTQPATKLVVNFNTVGIAPPNGAVVHVVGSDPGASSIVLDGITNCAWFRGRLALGTAAVPLPLGLNSYMTALAGRGYLATAYAANDLGRVAIAAEEVFTNATAKTGIVFETTAAGSVASSEKMRLNGDGNLGIGTSLPSFILDVVSSTAGNNLMKMDIYTNTATNGAGIYARKARGTSSSPLTVSTGDELGKFLVQGYNGSFRSAGGIWNVVNTSTLDGSILPTDWVIGFDAQATSTPTKNITLKYSGNVGLGVALPVNKLDVEGGAAIGTTYSGTNTAPTNGLLVEGNVGMGTSSPWSNLHVVGAASDPSLTNGTRSLQSWNWPSGSELDLTISSNSPFTASFQTRYTLGSGTTYPLALNPLGGNVGVGTTNPTARFHVAGDGAAIFAGFNILQTARFRTNANGSIILDGGQTAGTSYLRGISWGFLSEDFGLTRYRIDQGVAPITDFYINTAGNVAIGHAAPGSKFDVGVNGDGTVARANAWNTFSDARWKKDVTPITNGLALVEKLQGVNYTWKANDKKDFGFIAQEVEKVLPLAVHTDDKGYKSVDYARITSVLVEAVKEQQFKIDNQQSTINNQQKIIDELKSTNQNLKAENTQQENRLQKIEQQLSEIKSSNIQTQK